MTEQAVEFDANARTVFWETESERASVYVWHGKESMDGCRVLLFSRGQECVSRERKEGRSGESLL